MGIEEMLETARKAGIKEGAFEMQISILSRMGPDSAYTTGEVSEIVEGAKREVLAKHGERES